MSTGKMHTQILGLDNTISLEEVMKLMKHLDYSEEISYLSSNNELSQKEKTLCHEWGQPSDIKIYETVNFKEDGPVRYFTNTGFIENALPKNEAYIDDKFTTLLPRERRIRTQIAKTLFFEYAHKVYAVIYGSKSDMKIKSVLMGQGYGERRKKEWSKLEFPLPQYKLSSDFFYWMYYKYIQGSVLNTPNGKIEINDVEGIGRYSEREQHTTRGTGPKSTSELAHLTALGINQLVYESDFEIKYQNKYKVNFSLNIDSSLTIDKKRSIIISSNGPVNGIDGNEVFLLLKFYLDILPGLIRTYFTERDNGDWSESRSRKVRKDYALHVIRELCSFHDIRPEELTKLQLT